MTAVTPADMRAAWEAMRERAVFRHWPADYDAVMADPVACRLVRLEATGRCRHRVGLDPPASSNRPRWPAPRESPSGLDFKSRAAGEQGD